LDHSALLEVAHSRSEEEKKMTGLVWLHPEEALLELHRTSQKELAIFKVEN
jgi:hypothetical protein